MSGRLVIGCCGLLVLGALGAGVSVQVPSARFVVQHPWAAKGEWLRADTHIHSKFSDGAQTVEEIVAQAVQYGCQAVGITDHADRTLGGASAEYEAAIQAVRRTWPGLIVVAGLEWNVPPSGGDEHVSVLVPQDASEGVILAEFKRRFDDFEREDGPKPRAEDALAWLADATKAAAVKPVVVYNHPSRKDESSLSNVEDIVRWRAVNDLIIGFESGPGHQGKPPLGSYGPHEPVIDRWDPVAARPGDAWDRLLQRGLTVHGAMASSDFHNASPGDLNDFWPCQFAETWYYVPERTTAGLLRAMRAGTFFGVHGHIAQDVRLTVSARGLSRPAIAGEGIEVPAGTTVTASVAMTIPEADWNGQPNRIDTVDFIVSTPDDVIVQSQPVLGTGSRAVNQPLVVTNRGLVVRARGRRVVPDGPDLMFYTNAIRVSATR